MAPIGINDILRDADVLLELMGKEPLGVVADLANTLTVSAHEAGARDIEEAASNVRASPRAMARWRSMRCREQCPSPCLGHAVALTGAMRALTDAIARTERSLAA